MAVFAVTTMHGPNWLPGKGIRDQPGWTAHATYFDSLTESGAVILGGPITTPNPGEVALLAMQATDEAELRELLAADPWARTGVLRIKSVHPWTLWLDSRKSWS